MAGLGNIVTTSIITNGLTGGYNPIVVKHGIITSKFSLYYNAISPVVKNKGRMFGGQNVEFNVVDIDHLIDQSNNHDSLKNSYRADTNIQNITSIDIYINLAGISISKQYSVTKTNNIMINTINIISKVKPKYDIVINKIKNLMKFGVELINLNKSKADNDDKH